MDISVALSVYGCQWHTLNWHLTSGIYSATFKENPGIAFKHDLFKFLVLYINTDRFIFLTAWVPPKCQWLNEVILKPISHLLPPNPSVCPCVLWFHNLFSGDIHLLLMLQITVHNMIFNHFISLLWRHFT